MSRLNGPLFSLTLHTFSQDLSNTHFVSGPELKITLHMCVLLGLRASSFSFVVHSLALLSYCFPLILSFSFQTSISLALPTSSSATCLWGLFYIIFLDGLHSLKLLSPPAPPLLPPPGHWMGPGLFVQWHHCIEAHLARWTWGVTIPLSLLCCLHPRTAG